MERPWISVKKKKDNYYYRLNEHLYQKQNYSL